jgi:hypothetical protein
VSRHLLLGAWLGYRDHVVPPNAGPEQLEGTEWAFYAGATSVLGILRGISESAESDAAGVAVLEALHAEVRAHAADIARKAGLS